MKKRLSALISVILALALPVTTTAFAEAIPVKQPAGEVVEIDLLDADTPPDSDSYMIVDDDEVLLRVIRSGTSSLAATANLPTDDEANSCYTAEFMIPDTDDLVYLTGLTLDNVEEIRQEIIRNYRDGSDFLMTDLGFIDAEKTYAIDGDDNLCWAATSANLLTYTGWAEQGGFNSTDDLFEAFINAFEDRASSVYYGVGWFFNGTIGDAEHAQCRPGTGSYLPQYDYNYLIDKRDLNTDAAENLSFAYDKLREGYGVALLADIYSTEYEGGHAISCWGFVTDTRYPAYSKQHYKYVFITDSDSDKNTVTNGKDRRDAKDVMGMFALDSFVYNGWDTYSFHISRQQIAVLRETITLHPYLSDLPSEDAPDATLDPHNTPDIYIRSFFLTDDRAVAQTQTFFEAGADIYYQAQMVNKGEETYVGPLQMRMTVTNAEGEVVYSRTLNHRQNQEIPPGYGTAFTMICIDPPPEAGDYTITADFNPEHNISEAYYYNNTKSVSFKVRDKYLIGDVDNNHSVTIMDATLAQRMLANLPTDVDERGPLRGDVNVSGDLDIVDATLIQRYLVDIEIEYTIDTERFYE